MKTKSIYKAIIVIISLFLMISCKSDQSVNFEQKDNQIDIFFDKKYITSYLFAPDLPKPILYPIHSSSGVIINRGFPLIEIERESRDHPHHAGIWFACDEVNGNSFWNNVEPPPQIQHVRITEMKGGKEKGTISVVLNWIGGNDKTLMEEDRKMIFYPGEVIYGIDFIFTLKAIDTTVTIHDTKEGLFAIRVADWLSEKFGTGRYLSSNGDETEAQVWGTRAKWVRLEGEKDGQRIGVVIMNHHQSINYPTYWMARGYGLFSANPIGQYIYQQHHNIQGAKPLNLTLEKGESVMFRFYIVIYEDSLEKAEIDQIFENYSKN